MGSLPCVFNSGKKPCSYFHFSEPLFPSGFSEDKGQRQLLTILRSKSAYIFFNLYQIISNSPVARDQWLSRAHTRSLPLLVREDLFGRGSRRRDPDITGYGASCIPAPPASARHPGAQGCLLSCCVGKALPHAGLLLEKRCFVGSSSTWTLIQTSVSGFLLWGPDSVRHVVVSFPMCADPWSRLAEGAALATSFLESGAQLSRLRSRGPSAAADV